MSWDCKIAICNCELEEFVTSVITFLRTNRKWNSYFEGCIDWNSYFNGGEIKFFIRARNFGDVSIFDILFEGDDHGIECSRDLFDSICGKSRIAYFFDDGMGSDIFIYSEDGNIYLDIDAEKGKYYVDSDLSKKYEKMKKYDSVEKIKNAFEASSMQVGPIFDFVKILMPNLITRNSEDMDELDCALIGELPEVYLVRLGKEEYDYVRLEKGDYRQYYQALEYDDLEYSTTFG